MTITDVIDREDFPEVYDYLAILDEGRTVVVDTARECTPWERWELEALVAELQHAGWDSVLEETEDGEAFAGYLTAPK